MNWKKGLRWISVATWGALGLVFGLGIFLAGLHALPSPGGVFTLVLGLVLGGCAYFFHRLTCWAINSFLRPAA